jgi:predicted N-acyltransferase
VVLQREVKVFKTIDEIGKESTDSLADDGFFTYGYFKTVETSEAFNITPFYLAVADEDKIVAIASCYIDSSNQFLGLGKFPLTRGIANAVNHFGFRPNHLIVGYSPNSFHSKILLKENCDAKMILSLLSKKINDICRSEKILFSSFLHVPESERLLIETLEDFGYLKFPSVNTFYLDINWSSFDEYLESLESHKIRTTVRREIKKCRENGVIFTEEKDFKNLSIILSNLNSTLYSKYKGVSPHNALFFRKLSEYAKDKTRVLVAKRSDQIVGFSLSLEQKDVLDVHLCGFDYGTQTKTDFTYFNASYYVPIRLAIEEGIKKVHFSINSDREKLKRGCKLEKTFSFIKCHNKILAPLYSLYSNKRRLRQSAG